MVKIIKRLRLRCTFLLNTAIPIILDLHQKYDVVTLNSQNTIERNG